MIPTKKMVSKLFKDEVINLSELKELLIIDFEQQKKIKDYIDNLVFALYFNVPIKDVGLDKAKVIKEACRKNKFYSVVNGK